MRYLSISFLLRTYSLMSMLITLLLVIPWARLMAVKSAQVSGYTLAVTTLSFLGKGFVFDSGSFVFVSLLAPTRVCPAFVNLFSVFFLAIIESPFSAARLQDLHMLGVLYHLYAEY